MNCTELNKNCKKCGRKFDRHERYVDCDECGAPRACQNKAVTNSRWCHKHGGPHSKFSGRTRIVKHGKYSNSRLMQISAKYAEMTKNPVLTNLRPAIAVVRQRVLTLMSRIDQNQSAERMAKLKSMWDSFKNAEDGVSKTKAMARLDKEFEAVYHDYASWEQIMKAIDLERKLSESEVKILKDMQAFITAEDAHDLTAKLLSVIIKVLQDDPKRITEIRREFTRVIGEESYIPDEAGGETLIDIEPRFLDRGALLHTGDAGGSNIEGQDALDAVPEGGSQGGAEEG